MAEAQQASFGHDSTAAEVVEGLNFAGKNVLITGTSAGIGVETARTFLSIGATVIGAVRNLEKMATVAEEKGLNSAGGTFDVIQCDLASFESIRAFAAAFREKYNKIDVLICNAGVMATNGRRETADGFEFQFGVCHLGHFLMVSLLADLMMDVEGGSRLVTLSSVGHKLSPIQFDDMQFSNAEYNTWRAYGQAKTANVLFAKEFNRRYAGRGALGFSAHPGGIQTELGREMTGDSIKDFLEIIQVQMSDFGTGFKTVPQGAATSVFAATSSTLGPEQGGSYLHDCAVVTEIWSGEMGPVFSEPNVAEYAMSDEQAQRLWVESEKLVGQEFPNA